MDEQEFFNHCGYGLSRLNGLLLSHEAHVALIVGMQYRGSLFKSMLEHPSIDMMRARAAGGFIETRDYRHDPRPS